MSKRWPDKVIVGLTGNIATGKSTVMHLAEQQGALALDADLIVHEILATDPGVQRSVINAFGSGVGRPDGTIDRAALAAIVFDDEEALRNLERILHPLVRDRLIRRINQHRAAIVFIEAIKLLEGGLAAECDQIWVTRCPVATQLERLMTYRDLDAETAQMRVNAQSDQALKATVADVVIDTGGTLEQTRTYFEMAWRRLLRGLAEDVPMTDESGAEPQDNQDVRDDWVEERDDAPLQDSSPVNNKPYRPAESTRNYEAYGEGIVVRRAQPSDIPAIAEVVQLASQGRVTPEEDQLVLELGERGYLIGQQNDKISAIAGWYADNLVASIDFIYVHPSDAIPVTGAAVLQEIETTANELTCEVILAVPGDGPAGIRELLIDRGFNYVVTESLPRAWQTAMRENRQPAETVMMRVLRDTRQVRIRTIKEHHGQY